MVWRWTWKVLDSAWSRQASTRLLWSLLSRRCEPQETVTKVLCGSVLGQIHTESWDNLINLRSLLKRPHLDQSIPIGLESNQFTALGCSSRHLLQRTAPGQPKGGREKDAASISGWNQWKRTEMQNTLNTSNIKQYPKDDKTYQHITKCNNKGRKLAMLAIRCVKDLWSHGLRSPDPQVPAARCHLLVVFSRASGWVDVQKILNPKIHTNSRQIQGNYQLYTFWRYCFLSQKQLTRTQSMPHKIGSRKFACCGDRVLHGVIPLLIPAEILFSFKVLFNHTRSYQHLNLHVDLCHPE